MWKRVLWTGVLLAVLVWSGWELRPFSGRLDLPLSRQLGRVAVLAWYTGLASLIPLAFLWGKGRLVGVRRLRVSARICGVTILLLALVSLGLHLTLDHGPQGMYRPWRLGFIVFTLHHLQYPAYGAMGLALFWLMARHVTRVPAEPLEPRSNENDSKVVQRQLPLSAAFLTLVGFLFIGTLLMKHSGPSWPGDDRTSGTNRVVVTQAEPLGGDHAPGAQPCSLEGQLLLRKNAWMPWVEIAGVAPSCRYRLQRARFPEEDERCLLEYPLTTANGIEAANLGATIAQTYHRNYLGGNSLRLYSSRGADRLLLVLDRRWCEWDSIISGLRLVP